MSAPSSTAPIIGVVYGSTHLPDRASRARAIQKEEEKRQCAENKRKRRANGLAKAVTKHLGKEWGRWCDAMSSGAVQEANHRIHLGQWLALLNRIGRLLRWEGSEAREHWDSIDHDRALDAEGDSRRRDLDRLTYGAAREIVEGMFAGNLNGDLLRTVVTEPSLHSTFRFLVILLRCVAGRQLLPTRQTLALTLAEMVSVERSPPPTNNEPDVLTRQANIASVDENAPPTWDGLGEAKRAILKVLSRPTVAMKSPAIAIKAGYKDGTLRHHYTALKDSKLIITTKDGYKITPPGRALIPSDKQ